MYVVNWDLIDRLGLDRTALAGQTAHDLWGDTVNTASRMESHGLGYRLQCTERLYKLLGDHFTFEPRGEIEIKGKGSMPTYFLIGTR